MLTTWTNVFECQVFSSYAAFFREKNEECNLSEKVKFWNGYKCDLALLRDLNAALVVNIWLICFLFGSEYIQLWSFYFIWVPMSNILKCIEIKTGRYVMFHQYYIHTSNNISMPSFTYQNYQCRVYDITLCFRFFLVL